MVLVLNPKLSRSLPVKAVECTKWESRTTAGLMRKERRSTGRMASGRFTRFLNTIWRQAGIEGGCTRLLGELGGRFAVTSRSWRTRFSRAMHVGLGDMGNGCAGTKAQAHPGSSGKDRPSARELD